MCGRYSFYPPKNFASRFSLDLSSKDLAKLTPNGNVTPGQVMPVITKNDNSNQLDFMKWGLIPAWAKNYKIDHGMINARSESLTSKPSFKDSFKNSRCLIPATGFYEWQKTGKISTPYLFQLKDQSLFSFAGLYDNSTYTIITTSPNSLVEPIHHRMPVILSQSDESTWLDPSTDPQNLISLLSPFDSDQMSSIPKPPVLTFG